MCGYYLQAEIKVETGWRWFAQLHYPYKQEGAFDRALAEAQQAVRAMKAEHGGPWSRYRLMESNCTGSAWQLDLHSGETVKSDWDDPRLFLGSAFYPKDIAREQERRAEFERLMAIASGRSAMRRVIKQGGNA